VLILDTDHLTIIQRRNEPAYSNLVARLGKVSSTEICTTIVNFEEQMRGWLAIVSSAKDPKQEVDAYYRLHTMLTFFRKMPVLEYDVNAGQCFSQLRQMKLRVGTMDLKIAAIVISQKGLLLSRNLADFQRVPGLQVEDWTI